MRRPASACPHSPSPKPARASHLPRKPHLHPPERPQRRKSAAITSQQELAWSLLGIYTVGGPVQAGFVRTGIYANSGAAFLDLSLIRALRGCCLSVIRSVSIVCSFMFDGMIVYERF